MPTRKTASTKKGSSKKSATAATTSGAVPPSGIAIREAVGRGDGQEMKKVATSARRYLKTIQAALDKLDQALAKQK